MPLNYGNPEIQLPTKWGEMQILAGEGCLLIYKRPWEEVPLIRIHSACMFGESLGGLDCDCRLQLDAALQYVAKQGGVIAYFAQEGRGIGLAGKVAAMALQREEGIDTASAYRRLGHAPDPRDYVALKALMDQIELPKAIKLDTNNPLKVQALSNMGYVVERQKLTIEVSDMVKDYLHQKRTYLGHYG
jgi:GTP cyclohydrolase II